MNKPFCAAPWNHLAMRASRRFGLCCLSLYRDDDAQTFEEHWNSPQMKTIRVQMMNGKPPADLCKRCIKGGTSTPDPVNTNHNSIAEPYLEEMLQKTSLDGTTTFVPKTIDFRTDHCNFKCRVCNSGASTSIRNEQAEIGNRVPIYGKVEEISKMDLPSGFFENLEHVYWAGGEPFMSPMHWNVMDKLVEVGNTKAHVRYNTNASFPGTTLDKAINVLKNFDSVMIGASIDGFGEDVEYIREGLKFWKFCNNLESIRLRLPQAKIMCVYNATSLGLLSLTDILSYCENVLKVESLHVGVMVLEEAHPLWFNSLRPKVFSKLIVSISDYAKTSKFKDQLESYVNFLCQKYNPIIPEISIITKLESLRGKEGYFENRMKGLLNQPDKRNITEMGTDIKPLCYVPWNHLHTVSTKEFGLCCMSKYHDQESKTFDEHWNSVKMKNLRLAMINGNPPPEMCIRCLDTKVMSTPSYVWRNKISEKHLPEILEKTQMDGTTTFFPRTAELRTDLCNLACRMCDDNSSSHIRGIKIKAGRTPCWQGEVNSTSDSGLTDDRIKDLELITWAGGEPFMSPMHWEVMDKLVKFKKTDLQVNYNSNMMFPGKTLDKTVKLLKKFKNVKIVASLDGVGEDVEYLREGLDYQKFCDNTKKVQSENPHVKIVIGFTAMSMGVLTLDEVVKLCLDLNIDFEGRNVVVQEKSGLSINALKKEVLVDALDRAVNVAKGTSLEKNIEGFKTFLLGKYKPIVQDKTIIDDLELVRGKSGYFETRMKGLLNE
jgi:sulfatase maturation enzyme AslB (radical SAM superfamily)